MCMQVELSKKNTFDNITVSGQTPRQSISYIFTSSLANVTSMLIDRVATFVC